MRNDVGENLKIRKKILLVTGGAAVLALLVVGALTALATAAPYSQVYEAGKDGVGHASCVYCPRPDYSDQALRARYEGAVTLHAVITAQGRATKIKVVKSPGLGLDKEAVNVVKRWKFKPALGPNGNPVDVETSIDVAFRLPTAVRN
jgi:TonB family protein